MTRLFLVRHAHSAAGFGAARDPGLDEAGVVQAAALVTTFGSGGPRPIVTSPLRRTRETAAPLARAWGVEPIVERRVGEIPAPTDDLEQREEWLREVLRRRWPELGPELTAWRAALVEALLRLTIDTVVVTHYVAINTVVGVATGDDRLVSFSPGYCSVTAVEVREGRLALIERGSEQATTVT